MDAGNLAVFEFVADGFGGSRQLPLLPQRDEGQLQRLCDTRPEQEAATLERTDRRRLQCYTLRDGGIYSFEKILLSTEILYI